MTRLTPAEWNTATHVCTPQQLLALDYWNHGYGYKRISIVLEVSIETTRGRITRGLGAIQRAQHTPSDPPATLATASTSEAER